MTTEEFQEMTSLQKAVARCADDYLDGRGVPYTFNRRAFVKMALAAVAGVAAAGPMISVLEACGGSASTSNSGVVDALKAAKTGQLYGFNYSFFTKPEIFATFKSQSGVSPNWTTFTPPGTTQIPKLQEHPGLWDLVVVSSNVSKFFIDAKLLQPWDLNAIPNYKTIFPNFTKFDNSLTNNMSYEVPIFWGHNSIAYSTAAMDASAAGTIQALFDPRNGGKIAMQNQPPESFAVAGLSLGVKSPFNMSDDELKRAQELLVKQKPLVRMYWTQLGELAPLFASKELTIAWAWPPIVALTQSSGVRVDFLNELKEGATGWDTGWGLAKAAKNVYEAHEFVNWELSGDRIRSLADLNYASTSKQALQVLKPDELVKFHMQDPQSFLGTLAFQDFSWKTAQIQKMWQEVRTA